MCNANEIIPSFIHCSAEAEGSLVVTAPNRRIDEKWNRIHCYHIWMTSLQLLCIYICIYIYIFFAYRYNIRIMYPAEFRMTFIVNKFFPFNGASLIERRKIIQTERSYYIHHTYIFHRSKCLSNIFILFSIQNNINRTLHYDCSVFLQFFYSNKL